MKIKLLELLTDVIQEVGDLKNVQPFEFTLTNRGGKFNIDHQDKTFRVNVSLSLWGDEYRKWLDFPPIIDTTNKPIYSVGYDIEGDDTQTFKGDVKTLIRIIKTVSEIVKDFINKKQSHNPIFVMFATGKRGESYEDQQKLNLYRAVLTQNLPQGWRMGYGNNNALNVKFLYLSK
jgi:hypothetical protein